MPSTAFNKQVPIESLGAATEVEGERTVKKESYVQILKSTAWVGGSSVLNILIGIARTKVMALLLGPSGFGLAGLYMSVANLTQSAAGMGINSSGVRQIAEATGTEDAKRIACTTEVLRRTSVVLGLLGAVILLIFAAPISKLTFGAYERLDGVYVLAAAVFLNIISAGQSALIQGMRRISDLAKMSVLGALFGTLATIPLVYFFREDGVAPSLVAVAAMTLAFSWWYSRKLSIETHSLTVVEVWREASTLLKLGIAFMVSNLLMMGSAYVVRIVLQHKAGLEATGLYQSAWTIGGLYVGMILQSMGADFYPRLTAAVHQHGECNRLVNEQARISMLLAGPGVLATLVFAPLVISAFYAASFGAAVEVLRWICMGIAMRVISWPMGFIIMAKGQQNLILLCEVSWTLVHLGLVWILIDTFGVDGAGIAFFASYVFHVGLTYAIVHNLTGFRWSGDNRQTALLYTSLIAAVFCGFQILPDVWASLFGVLAALLSGIYSLRAILTLTGNVRVFQVAQALASRLGLSGKVTAA